MTFLELTSKRKSVRKYDSQPVEDEKLGMAVEADRVAPSAHDLQP